MLPEKETLRLIETREQVATDAAIGIPTRQSATESSWHCEPPHRTNNAPRGFNGSRLL
jgi:hypothetical protein